MILTSFTQPNVLGGNVFEVMIIPGLPPPQFSNHTQQRGTVQLQAIIPSPPRGNKVEMRYGKHFYYAYCDASIYTVVTTNTEFTGVFVSVDERTNCIG